MASSAYAKYSGLGGAGGGGGGSFTPANLTAAGTDGIAVTGGTSAVNGSGTSIAQHVADATHNGYLASADWTTFNSKQSALTFSSPLVNTAGTISIPVATSGANGYLSSTDWSTFNGKQAAGNYITALTGDGTASGPGSAALTLATVNSGPGTFGSSSSTPNVTVNGKGLVTASASTAIQTMVGDTGSGGTKGFVPAPAAGDAAAGKFLKADATWAVPSGGGSAITSLTGDVTGTGPGATATTLATVNANVGSFGTATGTGTFTVNGKGLITAASTTPIAGLAASVITTGTLATARGGTNLDTSASSGVMITTSGTWSAVAAGTTRNVLTSDGTTWASTAQATSSAWVKNLGLSASVAASALTVTLRQFDGASNPSTGSSAVLAGFRGTTAATGSYSEVSRTTSLNIVVASGSTLGTSNGVAKYIYVYLINNAGTVELAVSGSLYDEGSLVTTTIITSASSGTVIYSTTARTSVALRLVGRLLVNEATAGTWASAPTEISLAPFKPILTPTIQKFTTGSGTYTTPSNATYIRVRMVGGGGGGGGSGSTASGGTGTTGGNSTFGSSLLVANGGAGGVCNATSGAGGTASLGTGPLGTAISGGRGAPPAFSLAGNSGGGNGASTPFGGEGPGGFASAGADATANTGSGGGGAGGNTTLSSASGGSAAGFVDAIIGTPSATYAYAVGAVGTAGTAGTGGAAGGAGAAGYIEVTEYYQ